MRFFLRVFLIKQGEFMLKPGVFKFNLCEYFVIALKKEFEFFKKV